MTRVSAKPRCAWKDRIYPVPKASKSGFRWKASALRGLNRWTHGERALRPAIVVVPALYNRLPAETVAMGWLNEIDALHLIRQRLTTVARKTGWDVFTFHTQHNLDHFYDSTITAVRETWTREGSLSAGAIHETRRRFGNIFDYHKVQPRLIENLVFQSSLIEWVASHSGDAPVQFHVVGTALYSALAWSRALAFEDAVDSAVRVGSRWDQSIRLVAEERAALASPATNEPEIGWQHFELVQRIIDGAEDMRLAVSRQDLPKVEAPSTPFWFSPANGEDPVLIETARDAAFALESLNLMSWAAGPIRAMEHTTRGWLVSPLHPLARACRWSVCNYLLSTPASTLMFIDHIASLGRKSLMPVEPDVQNRLRLSRMKVTGP